MPVVIGIILVEALKKLSVFVTLALVMLLLPAILPGGISITDGSFSVNILSPLTNILAAAPEGLRFFVWYTHTDTALVVALSAAIYGFIKDMLFAVV